MHYKYGDSTVTLLETIHRQFSSMVKLFPRCLPAMAMPEAGGSAVECGETNCGTVPTHYVADPNYIDTLYKASGVTFQPPTVEKLGL
ncbi:hypothetical protein DPV78_008375 [Talaromyces pinophilus]|nr:hypothetical protein DPV78_008375 [Talaromyces pinophilus]